MEVRHVRGPGATVPPVRPRTAHRAGQRPRPGRRAWCLGVGQHGHEPAGARPRRVHRRPVGRRAEPPSWPSSAAGWWPPPTCCGTATGEEVGEAYRGTAEINWLLYWPEASYWPDSAEAAGSLMDACLGRLRSLAGGRIGTPTAPCPRPACTACPEQWPHVRALYERVGFVHDGHVEIVLLARVDELPRPSVPPVAGLRVAGRSGSGRHPAVGPGRRRADRLHRGRDQPGRGRAPGPPGRLGRRRATSTWTRPTGGAASPPGWSGRRRTGCGWPGWSACSSTPGPRSRTSSACWAGSASAS